MSGPHQASTWYKAGIALGQTSLVGSLIPLLIPVFIPGTGLYMRPALVPTKTVSFFVPRARIASQNALTSKKLDCSLLPSDSALSFPKSDEHAPVLSLELSRPSSPTTTSQVINGKDAAAAISERAPLEQQRVETAAANDEALLMETETIAVVSS